MLNAGKEKAMLDEDLGLEQHCSMLALMNHTVTMTSLAFDYLAENDKQTTFLHTSPGLVKTDIIGHLAAPESSGVVWRVVLASLRGLAAIMLLFFGMSVEESGERQASQLTSDTYSPGAWPLGYMCDQISALGVLEQYRERRGSEKVWEHTSRVFDQAFATGGDSIPK